MYGSHKPPWGQIDHGGPWSFSSQTWTISPDAPVRHEQLCGRRKHARSVQYDRPIFRRHLKGTLPLTIVFEPIGAVGDRRRVLLRSVLKLCEVLCKLGRHHRPDDTLVVRKVD